jgi:cellulose synthase/poly-beta-1,6-N-acetylglucosamine synthase-like glycosyltransferase
MILGYFIASFVYKLKSSNWLKTDDNGSNRGRQQQQQQQQSIRLPCLARPLTIVNNATVSFLIAAYNEEKIIARCIESIDRAASKYSGKTEIIVVNDGSTDQTPFIIDKTIRKLKHRCRLDHT